VKRSAGRGFIRHIAGTSARWPFEPVEAAALCARTLRDRMEENHEFGYAIALRLGQMMLERLQATRLRLLEMYGVPS
jgi:CRP-like cAMP-binding protein